MGALGSALLGAGFFESRKTGEVRAKSLFSTAGSHVWAAFWLIISFSILSIPTAFQLCFVVYFPYNKDTLFSDMATV